MKRGQTWQAQLSEREREREREREFDRYNQGRITEKISLKFYKLTSFCE